MRRALAAVWHTLAIVGLITSATLVWFAATGISTRTEPSSLEAGAARALRHALVPADARTRRNPEAATVEVVTDGLTHWADHCAPCHGNDGSGDTEMGRSLYPRAPDMRLPATQNLSDGELHYIIEHGVKLTGMPAWGTGTPESARSSWRLVHFIRRLPSITESELAEMEQLNPRSVTEWRRLEEERRFLAGEPPLMDEPQPGPTHSPHGTHREKGRAR
jgi:mono/diheme cytochrome c family protein